MERPYLGCSLRSMIDKAGMMILLVNSESPASIAGLKVSDILIEIDGIKINNINDYYSAIAANREKKKIFKVIRNGEERMFEINL
jgi:S1-C subfamily serine protease